MWALLATAALLLGSGTQTAGAVSVSITGPEQEVFDWDTMHCFPSDGPDGATRAFRDSLGRVQLTLNGANTRMIGPDLDNLTHDCTVVLRSNYDPLPSNYDDWLFLGGAWTHDGQEVFRLIHTEYHGREHAGFCQGQFVVSCDFNTITFARSTDGGASYAHAPAPAHLVAALPYPYVPSEGRVGYFAPSNIVEKDGFYYSMILASLTYKEQKAGVCLMRTRDLANPRSWRAWDGSGFNSRFIDPYRESPEPLNRHVCEPIAPDELGVAGSPNRSLTYNTYLGKYVATGTSSKYDVDQGKIVQAFYFSLSDDLIHWTDRQILMEVVTGATYMCGLEDPAAYPVLLDPDAPDRNLTITDRQTYLFFMRHRQSMCQPTGHRDLVRVPIEFTQ
jgi:hypothetical protein